MTPDFSCERCQDSLPWYIANLLPPDERAALERHLASCARCLAALDEWRDVASALHSADERIPLDTASLSTWAQISRRLAEPIVLPGTTNDNRTTVGLHVRRARTPTATMPACEPPVARPRTSVSALASLVVAVALIALSAGIFSLLTTRGGSGGSHITRTPAAACTLSHATAK